MKTYFTTVKLALFAMFLASFGFTSIAQEYRTISGVNNNLQHPQWGSAGTNLLRTTTNGYADGMYLPGGTTRPNPRLISNLLFMQNSLVNDKEKRSALVWGWGQLMDHDFSLVIDHPTDVLPIVVPLNDAYFDPQGTGQAVIPMRRSKFDPNTGNDPSNPRLHVNEITAFIDASFVYGSDPQRAAWLRTFQGGKLKTSNGNMMPFNTTTGEYDAPVDPTAPGMDTQVPNPKLYVAGDVRANENPSLSVLHHIFVGEHNLICNELAAQHPNWTDHQLYHQARKILGAKVAAITYQEWLPGLGVDLSPYAGYNPGVNPGITNEFSAAAFRLGHTMLTGIFPRLDENFNTIPEGDLMLRHSFFNVHAVRTIGVEPYLRGMSQLMQQDVDCKVIDDVRHFLFGAPGAGGLDLISINIQRGRERGLSDYNTIRVDVGLDPVSSFFEITADPLMAQSLEDVYGNVNNVDLWIGMLAEDHMPGAVFGPTLIELLKRQFEALRDGDRFYYENDPWLTPDQKNAIRNTRLSDIISRNTNYTDVQDNVFFVEEATTSAKELHISHPEIELTVAPVPTTGPCTAILTIGESAPAILQLVDMRGATLWEQKTQLQPGQNTFDLNLDHRFPAGTYYFLVKTGYRTANYKLIVKLN